ncbi:MAG TPA: protein translocase subunit SecD [Frankiaceae bacterium]
MALYVGLGLTGHLTPKLGLDLEGGTSVILTPKVTNGGGQVTPAAINQAVDIIRQRVNNLGVAESTVVKQNNQIVISVPGRNRDDVVSLVGRTAELRFREVICSTSSTTPPTATATTCTDELSSGHTPTVTPTPEGLAAFNALQCTDPVKRASYEANDNPAAEFATCSTDGATKYLLAPARVVGTDVKTATATTSANSQGVSTGAWVVNIDFTGKGQAAWSSLTKDTVGGRVAIVLDGLVQSAPTIQQEIDGPAQISGSFTAKTANDLANILKYGALPLAFQQSQAESVSATLGRSSLHAGLLAGALGLALVIVYCFIYYRLLGVVTVLSLLVSGALVYAMTCLLGQLIGFTLTLAGIAGFIVSVGITADSFVVFYERVKDEVHEGRSVRSAVERGWVRARRTILTADTVSLLAAVVLYSVSIGDVRGFAFTLGLSTLLDLFVVFLFTKPTVSLLVRLRLFSSGRHSGLVRTARRPAPSTIQVGES